MRKYIWAAAVVAAAAGLLIYGQSQASVNPFPPGSGLQFLPVGPPGPQGTNTGVVGPAIVYTNSLTLSGSNCNSYLIGNAASLTFTLAVTPPSANCFFGFQNINSSSITIARNGVALYVGTGSTSNITLTQGQSTRVITDGTSYYATNPN